MFFLFLKNMAQKLSLLLLAFGLTWGLMLLCYTFQQPRHQSSVKLCEQILDLSKRFVKALAEENKITVCCSNSLAGQHGKRKKKQSKRSSSRKKVLYCVQAIFL
uniref:MGT5A-like N-terminal domain-containing protein n=1 Tax=Marmota marmota marmota TaxID=9994 RepID=A0A8C5Z3A8_MARMA